ncbi:adenosine receptor A3-like [Actinia tenebrosa]|uniref:Adenosine receptor A3-like n=1 Tax=Actinia tenebrosa TaxID=6105 RepID=A0A6P8I394_ACTTE|nr:adenosine receptor A3-like [Actinia tenebrosa]
MVPNLQTFLAWSYAIVSIPTILLNLIVLLAIRKTPSLYRPTQTLLASLALTDLLYGLVVMPILVASNILALHHSQDYFCKVWTFARAFGHWLGGVSLYTLALISIDRLLAIKLRLSFRVVFTAKRCVMALSVGWLGGGFLVGVSYVVSLMSKYTVVIAMFILVFTIVTSYAMAYYNLKKITSIVVAPSNLNEQNNPNSSTSFSASRYKRSFNTMLLILLTTAVFYLPMATALAMESFIHQDWTHHATRIGELIMSINSTCNPLLYLWCIKELREAVKNFLKI